MFAKSSHQAGHLLYKFKEQNHVLISDEQSECGLKEDHVQSYIAARDVNKIQFTHVSNTN